MANQQPEDELDKLYKEIEYTVTMEYKAPNGEPAVSRINRLMKLIKEREARLIKEARIDELERLPLEDNGEGDWFVQMHHGDVQDRIKQLEEE